MTDDDRGDPYAALADDYHWLYDDVELRLGTPTPGVRGALTVARPGGRVLDVACGIGIDLLALTGRGFHVTGADASRAMLAEARRRLDAVDRVGELVCSSWAGLPERIEPSSFDLVICTGNSIAHAGCEPDMIEALESFRRMLVPGGLLVVDTHHWEVIERDGECFLVDPVVVERDGVRCTRTYDWRRTADGSGSWRLRLGFDLDDGLGIDRRRYDVLLHPFSPNELRDRLRRVGFVEIGIDADDRIDRYAAVARRADPG